MPKVSRIGLFAKAHFITYNMKINIIKVSMILIFFIFLIISPANKVNFNDRINFEKSDTLISSKFGLSKQICSGVNVHFSTGHEKDLDMIAAAGFKFIRMDLMWQYTEHVRGIYSWTAYDELISNLEKRGLYAILILDTSNLLYEPSITYKDSISGKEYNRIAAPQHTESIDAFARWAAAAAEHFKSKKIIWEIWNEPNIDSFWGPKSDAVQYSVLANAACKAIKSSVPNAIIVAPGSAGIPMPFLEKFIDSGILKYIDAISVHPYRDNEPETVEIQYKKLKDLINQNSQSKKTISVISGEWGYSTFVKGKGISLDKQAAYIVRMQLFNLISGIPISIWYDWKNDGINLEEKEHNFGIVMPDLSLKPAYTAIMTMNQQLKGFTIMSRIYTMNKKDYMLLFRNQKDNWKLVAWTTDNAHSVVIENKIPNINSTTAMNIMGKMLKIKKNQEKLVLDLNEFPQYINIPNGALKE